MHDSTTQTPQRSDAESRALIERTPGSDAQMEWSFRVNFSDGFSNTKNLEKMLEKMFQSSDFVGFLVRKRMRGTGNCRKIL